MGNAGPENNERQISVGTAHPVRSGGRPAVPGARGWGQGNPLRFGARGWGFLAVPTEICSSQLRSGSWDLELAVQVRQCLLRSGVWSWGPAWGLEPAVETRSWGPAVPTEMCSLQLVSGSAHWDLELAVGREEDGGGRREGGGGWKETSNFYEFYRLAGGKHNIYRSSYKRKTTEFPAIWN